MGYFDGMRNAKTFEKGGAYFATDSIFKVKIVRSFVLATQDKGDAFIVEFQVLKSSSEQNAEGSSASWYQSLTKKQVAFGAIKQFMYAALGYDEKKPTDAEFLKEKVDPQIENLTQEAIEKNALAGKMLSLQTFSKTTKNGGAFTVHNWSPCT